MAVEFPGDPELTKISYKVERNEHKLVVLEIAFLNLCEIVGGEELQNKLIDSANRILSEIDKEVKQRMANGELAGMVYKDISKRKWWKI